MLDLSGNFFLEFPQAPTPLHAFSRLRCEGWRAAARQRSSCYILTLPGKAPKDLLLPLLFCQSWISSKQWGQRQPFPPLFFKSAGPQPVASPPPPRWLDLRAVHVEEGGRYWSPAKCTTMQHVAALAKALRRKNRHAKILHDTS